MAVAVAVGCRTGRAATQPSALHQVRGGRVKVSNRSLIMLANALRQRRRELGTTWRRLDAGRQALLVLAHLRKGETYHLRKGETYRDLARGFAVDTTTVYRY